MARQAHTDNTDNTNNNDDERAANTGESPRTPPYLRQQREVDARREGLAKLNSRSLMHAYMAKTNRHSHSSNKVRSLFAGTGEKVGSNHNFELLLTQIFCIRLNLEPGIVSLGVGLSYDLLRELPCRASGFWSLSNGKCSEAIARWFSAERL
jgi:hypothetical protein